MKDNLSELLQIRNLNNGHAALYVYGEICAAGGYAWDDEDQYPEKVRRFLDDAQGKPLDVYINSPGGSVFAGMAIVNILRRHAEPKTCYVDGYAASIASVIALCCDHVVMPRNTYLMIHRASAFAGGTADEFRRYAELLEKCENGILGVYEGKLAPGVGIEQVRELMNNETWFTAEDAAKIFNVEVRDVVVEAAAFANVTLKSAPAAMKAQAALAVEVERTRLLKLKKGRDTI